MGQIEVKTDTAQSTRTQGSDPYRLPPELVAHLRAVLDAPEAPKK